MKKQLYLKVPAGLIKRANKIGKYSEVEFYYQLKGLKNDGLFKKEDWKQIKQLYKYADSTLYRKFDKLVKAGFAFEVFKGEYNLYSYAVIWISLGYNVDYCRHPLQNKNKSFKIFRISIKDVLENGFLIAVSEQEIIFQLNKQNWKERRKFRSTQKSKKVKTVKRYSLSQIFPELGARKIAKLLGFTSSSTGHQILKRLEELKRIIVERTRTKNGLPKCNKLIISKRTTRLR